MEPKTTTGSSTNPFRTPRQTPNPTGASSSSAPNSSSPPPGPPTVEPDVRAPPIASNETRDSDFLRLDEEEPPQYTPSADVVHGETTIELGPRRPFQPAPPQPVQQQRVQNRPQNSPQQPSSTQPSRRRHQGPLHFLIDQLTGMAVGTPSNDTWSSYPGRSQSQGTNNYGTSQTAYNSSPSRPAQQRNSSDGSGSNALRPPPRHPSMSRQFSSSTSDLPNTSTSYAPPPGPPPGSTSDFALDFYAAGPHIPGNNPLDDGSNTARPSSSTKPSYAPPSGRPPNLNSNSSMHNRSASASNASSQGGIPDDGRPTETPVPGHPYLNDGQLLVYPSGYMCEKCNNTGYKHFDPGQPCRRCWSKFSKPYAGPLLYTPWSSPSSSSTNATGSKNTFQRPLPITRSLTTPHGRQRSLSAGPYTPPAPMQTYPTPQSAHEQSPYSQSAFNSFVGTPPPNNRSGSHPRIVVSDPYRSPPPNSVVLRPGDPQLGGRPCYNCSGRGVTPFFLFEEVTCDVCGGVGRLY